MSLEPAAWYAASGDADGAHTNGIYLFAQPGAALRSTTCTDTIDPTVGTRARISRPSSTPTRTSTRMPLWRSTSGG